MCLVAERPPAWCVFEWISNDRGYNAAQRIHVSPPSVAMTNCISALLVAVGVLTAAAPINKPQFNLFLNQEQSRTFLGESIARESPWVRDR